MTGKFKIGDIVRIEKNSGFFKFYPNENGLVKRIDNNYYVISFISGSTNRYYFEESLRLYKKAS